MEIQWISTSEAAIMSGYRPEGIRRLVKQGKIKAVRKGTMLWIDQASLLAQMTAEGKTPPQSTSQTDPSVISAPGQEDTPMVTPSPPQELSPEADDYMKMAGRMLYDIIREWKESHQDKR